LINFYDGLTGWIGKGKATDIVYLDFEKIFNTVSYKILTEEMLMYGLDEQQ